MSAPLNNVHIPYRTYKFINNNFCMLMLAPYTGSLQIPYRLYIYVYNHNVMSQVRSKHIKVFNSILLLHKCPEELAIITHIYKTDLQPL